MMHYSKGENVEKETTKEEVVAMFDDVLAKDQDFLWMHVKGGTKLDNVITYAKKKLEDGEHRTIIWSGNGGGVVKTISCAEIMKRKLHMWQLTRMCYSLVEEHWIPQVAGLEEIVAKRQIPAVHILMSVDPLDEKIEGVQKSNQKPSYWNETYVRGIGTSGCDYRAQQLRASCQRDYERRNRNQAENANTNANNTNKNQKPKQRQRNQNKQKMEQNGASAEKDLCSSPNAPTNNNTHPSSEETQQTKGKKFQRNFKPGTANPAPSQTEASTSQQATTTVPPGIGPHFTQNHRPRPQKNQRNFNKLKPKMEPGNKGDQAAADENSANRTADVTPMEL